MVELGIIPRVEYSKGRRSPGMVGKEGVSLLAYGGHGSYYSGLAPQRTATLERMKTTAAHDIVKAGFYLVPCINSHVSISANVAREVRQATRTNPEVPFRNAGIL